MFSVIIPVHNGDRYLTEAVDSVLAQTYRVSEIIVVDDGSTDSSPSIAQKYRDSVHYEYQPQQGAGAARNRGVELARGNFLAFLDADDLWTTDKLTQQVKAFEHEAELDAVFGQVRQFHSPDLPPKAKDKIYCPPQLMASDLPSAMLVKWESFLRVGLFETHLQIGEFVSCYARVTGGGLQTKLVPELVALRRLHQRHTSLQRHQAKTDFARLLKASIDRRRSQSVSQQL